VIGVDEAPMDWKQGGCHCGAVRFEVLAPEVLTPDAIEVADCNCSICRMTGYLHLIVPAQHFRLLAGEERLTTYSFNTGTAQHRFCSVCGIKSFYVPRSHPDGFSVNMRCLDKGAFIEMQVRPFDGQHWEAGVAEIAGHGGA
jgi:hypothetical protein